MKKTLLSIAIVAVIVVNLCITNFGGSGNITLNELFNVAQATESESSTPPKGGLVCNGSTDCPKGHSPETNIKGENTSCCGKDTENTTGHYHT